MMTTTQGDQPWTQRPRWGPTEKGEMVVPASRSVSKPDAAVANTGRRTAWARLFDTKT